MTSDEQYEHERTHDRHPGGVYVGRGRPRVEMAAAEDEWPDAEPARFSRACAWAAGISVPVWVGIGVLVGLALSEFWS
jgi:uncharacterized membrane protein